MVRFKQLIKIKTRDTCKIFERINHLLLLLLLFLILIPKAHRAKGIFVSIA